MAKKKPPPKKEFFAGLFSEDPEKGGNREREEKEEQKKRERAAKEEAQRRAEFEKKIKGDGRKEIALAENRIIILTNQKDHHRRDCTDCLANRACATCDDFDSDIRALLDRTRILRALYPD
jgi:hypothetical protein